MPGHEKERGQEGQAETNEADVSDCASGFGQSRLRRSPRSLRLTWLLRSLGLMRALRLARNRLRGDRRLSHRHLFMFGAQLVGSQDPPLSRPNGRLPIGDTGLGGPGLRAGHRADHDVVILPPG